jgi:hemolysin D
MNELSRHWEIAKVALADDRARVKGRVESSQCEFLPAALEIIERPVSPTGRVTAYVLGAGLALTFGWAMFGKLDVVASAPGRLIPADNVKLIQSSDAGILRAILVRDGQEVRKGQALIELDPTVSSADTAQARSSLQTALLEVARAKAVLSALDGHGLQFVAPEATPPEIAQTQRALAATDIAAIEAGMSGRGADREAMAAARDEALTQAAKLNETIPMIDQQLEAYETLLARGFAAKLKVIEMRRQRLATIKDRDAAMDMARKTTAQLSSAGSTILQSRAEARAKVLTDLAKAQAEVSLRTEELVKSQQRSRLQRLVSPVDGTVAQLSVHTIGGVVEPIKPIMVVVPKGGDLVAEVKLLNKDAGFVRKGQDVAVKLEAFPFTRFGTVPGRVETISSDAVEDERLGLVYAARIRLDRAVIYQGDRVVSLTPGMAATADIRTGERSIMGYLISPIDQVRRNAGRER